VDPNGSVTVSLTEAIAYTITAAGPGGTASAGITIAVAPAVSAVADPAVLPAGGGTSVLTWNSSNADSCIIEPGIGSVDPNGSVTVSLTETGSYTLTSTGPGGTAIYSITIGVLPSVTITAEPGALPAGGGTSVLTWNTVHADSCVIEPGIGSVDPNGSVTVSLTETVEYILTATGPGGTSAASVTIQTVSQAPSAEISADPATLPAGGGTSVLTWNTAYADSCVIEPDIGSVDPNGSVTVSLTETVEYILTATGPGGTSAVSVTIQTGPLPEVSAEISANPMTLPTGGGTSVLTWSTENADSCFIEPDIGDVPCGDSVGVSLTGTTEYILTSTGSGGTATAEVTVTVSDVNISADPPGVMPGESSVLTWNSVSADSCVIEPDIGSFGPNGSVTVTPEGTTDYIVTVTGPEGSSSAGVRVVVYGDPTAAEQAHLEALNRARLNPPAEAVRLGIDLFEGVPEGKISSDPSPPLAF
ncbi:MAG: hypothetical protein GY709_05865, partial [Herbaspirillum sp.]|nr:hypothetical protein [Herbaspirillum sp.]